MSASPIPPSLMPTRVGRRARKGKHGRLDRRIRNSRIVDLWLAGYTHQQIADVAGLKRARVTQIIGDHRRHQPDRETLYTRELSYLDSLRQRVEELATMPLPPAHSVKGDILRDDDGAAVLDINGRLQAVDRLIRTHEKLAKMAGLEAPTRVQAETVVYTVEGVDVAALQ